jgi:hypothetical protein
MASRKTYDVFVSHALGDASIARRIVKACAESGLEAFIYDEVQPGENVTNAIWEALTESRALLTVISSSGPTSTMSIEIGAAKAWSKPIFAIAAEPSTRLPIALSGIQLYSLDRIDDVISAIKVSGQQLTDGDRQLLAELYSESETSVDQLALEPRGLNKIVKGFQDASGKRIGGEQLLSELLRMRKQGGLRRTRAPAKSRRGA